MRDLAPFFLALSLVSAVFGCDRESSSTAPASEDETATVQEPRAEPPPTPPQEDAQALEVQTSCYQLEDTVCIGAVAEGKAWLDAQKEGCEAGAGRFAIEPCPTTAQVAKCTSSMGTAYYYRGHLDAAPGPGNNNVAWAVTRKLCEGIQRGTFSVQP